VLGKSEQWDKKEMGELSMTMICKHIIKKSIPPDESYFPESLVCKKCSKKMENESLTTEEQIKDVVLVCTDCVSKEIRDRSYWRTWYQYKLKKFKEYGFDSIPCMEDLKSHQPLFDRECGVCNNIESPKNWHIEDPGKPDEFGCYIKQYFHCKKCINEKPKDQSASEWARLNAGFTAKGLEIWCNRHNISIIHLDFKGNKPEFVS